MTGNGNGTLSAQTLCSCKRSQAVGSNVLQSTELELILTDSSGNVACDVTAPVANLVSMNNSVSPPLLNIHLNVCSALSANKYSVQLKNPLAKSGDFFYDSQSPGLFGGGSSYSGSCDLSAIKGQQPYSREFSPLHSITISRANAGAPWKFTTSSGSDSEEYGSCSGRDSHQFHDSRGSHDSHDFDDSDDSDDDKGGGLLYVIYDVNHGVDDQSCDKRASPLVVDVEGDTPDVNFVLTSPSAGVKFEIEGANARPAPYSATQISWIANPHEYMFLVLPKDGQVLSADQMFGNNTLGPDGKFAANGFAALAKYDSNNDGVIDVNDPIYSKLYLWSNVQKDGVVHPGELHSLSSMNITRINLNYNPRFVEDDEHGNQFKFESFVLQNGRKRPIFDIWFVLFGQ